MLTLHIDIESNNASVATTAEAQHEAQHVLRKIANMIEAGERDLADFPIYDANGNKIGSAGLTCCDEEYKTRP